MGSDLIYDDMGDRGVEEYTFTLLRVENDNGTKMYVVQAIRRYLQQAACVGECGETIN